MTLAAPPRPAVIVVCGPIDQTTADRVAGQLERAGPARVWVNSPGGALFAGLEIARLLRDHTHRVETYVGPQGAAAASAAVWPTLAGDTVTIDPQARINIHEARWRPFRGQARTDSDQAHVAAINDLLARLLAARTGRTASYWAEARRRDTWLTAVDAYRVGLVDRIERVARPPSTIH